MVKQADEYDIPIIEEILLDAVNWMSKSGLQNQWNESNVKWSNLSKSYKIDNYVWVRRLFLENMILLYMFAILRTLT